MSIDLFKEAVGHFYCLSCITFHNPDETGGVYNITPLKFNSWLVRYPLLVGKIPIVGW